MEKFRVYGSASNEESKRELEHRALARKVAAEGMVLLKNHGVLPITEKKVALYGAGARMTVRGGTGSGDMNERYSVNIEQGLKNVGFDIPNTKWMDRFDHYYNKIKEEYKSGIEEKIKGYGPFRVMKMFDIIHDAHLRFPIGSKIQEDELSDNVSTAIYVVARQAGEGLDRKVEKGDFLLDDVEYYNIKLLSEHYEKLLLVINCGGIMDLSCLDKIPNIGAVLFFHQGGTEGGSAFADLVSGKVSPSGKLVDTWAMNYEDYPSHDTYSYRNGNLEDEDYLEGIYVGYRYFDTFGKTPRFEFGFGLSYTSFEQKIKDINVDKSTISMKVEVKNTGTSFAGKEVIQAYISKPNGRLDHEAKSLAAFVKTKELNPGECMEVLLTFDMREQASYDKESASWFLEAGEYGLYIGTSSRNNNLAAVIILNDEIITEKTENICPLKRDFTDLKAARKQLTYEADIPRFQLYASDMKCLTHVYKKPEINQNPKVQKVLATLTDEEMATLCVGASMFGKVFNNTPGGVGRTATNLLKKGIPNINFCDGPSGLNVIREAVFSKGGTQFYMYNLPDSVNWGFLKKINRFVTKKPHQGRAVYQYMTAWPAIMLQSQTWDVELSEQIGKAVGIEMLEIGCTLWLAPALNIHRNPLCGRNFEYYSEDPLISGKMAGAVTKGVQSHKGVGVTMKHFCCNNQEDNRQFVSENVSERALRELYLRGFQYVVTETKPLSVMTSYNKVNGVYTANSYDLLTKLLRNEWGYKGMVMSDWSSTGPDKASYELCPASGNDMIMPGSKEATTALVTAMKDGRLERDDVKRSAANVLNVIFNSAVVEGF